MNSTLYLLRQHPDRISSALFRSSDGDMDIVFMEQVSPMLPSSVKGIVVVTEGPAIGLLHTPMTYDDLIDKIFSSEHILVI